MARIGLRELRQNASVYLARVKNGEVIEVTVRGEVVGKIVPAGESPWGRLEAQGHIRAPVGRRRLEDIQPVRSEGGESGSAVLERMREHER